MELETMLADAAPARRAPLHEPDSPAAVSLYQRITAPPAEPPPATGVLAAARARPKRATWGAGAPGRHAPRRRWRLVAAAGLTAAVAAVVTAGVIAPGGARPADSLTVRELAYRAAAAAARQPAVRPGQWVFWREKTAGRGCGTGCGTFHVWTTADSQKAAWVYKNKVVSLRGGPFIGQPSPSLVPASKGGGWAVGAEGGKIPVTYADLGSLPRSPEALGRYLADLRFPHWQGWGSPAAREFTIIEMMLTSYVMPPRMTAELYRALGHIPGVAVDGHAKDVAGRAGAGFISPPLPGGGNEEIILSPRTYHLMGDSLLWGPRHRLLDGTAILREALVSGPGVRP
jgi:hypothetical protein